MIIDAKKDIQLFISGVISERKKNLAYTGFYGNTYFWRTEYTPVSTSVINSTNYWEFL